MKNLATHTFDIAPASLYNVSSPSPYLRNVSQGEVEPQQSTAGDNVLPDPNYFLQQPDHDNVSDGHLGSDMVSMTSSTRQFRSSRAIKALQMRQNRVAMTTMQIQEKLHLK